MSYSVKQFSVRHIHLIIFLIVGSLLGYAAYSMKVLGLEPCTLCITQQFFYCLIGLSSFVAFFVAIVVGTFVTIMLLSCLLVQITLSFLLCPFSFKVQIQIIEHVMSQTRRRIMYVGELL